ncbi:hydroxypyruvate isomerase [Hydrogenophaga sp. 5NK40-0174]|uniref:hydroxypyruvate isomerase n=1 Tax=Hydrogenophaga sp. 5NK40-0174 TaxID=3127649 RepID=UPI0031047B5B
MLRFSANISTLFTDRPFLDRFAAAARAGFTHVECQFPYEHPAAEVSRAMKDAGVAMVLHNLPAGDWTRGERGQACQPSKQQAFRDSVEQALAYARELGVSQLNCLAGIPEAGAGPEQTRQILLENMRHAAAKLAASGVRLLVEPINNKDVPGFYLNTSQQAFALMDELAADNVYLQYDLYHAQRMEGDLIHTMSRHMARIGHMQIADNPGRGEPGTGELRYSYLFDWLDRSGYAGFVGCEYFPADGSPQGTERGLRWLAVHGRRATGDVLK